MLDEVEFQVVLHNGGWLTTDQFRQLTFGQRCEIANRINIPLDLVGEVTEGDVVNVERWLSGWDPAPSWHKAEQSSVLYEDYRAWSTERRTRCLNDQVWGRLLTHMGLPARNKHGVRRRYLHRKPKPISWEDDRG